MWYTAKYVLHIVHELVSTDLSGVLHEVVQYLPSFRAQSQQLSCEIGHLEQHYQVGDPVCLWVVEQAKQTLKVIVLLLNMHEELPN